MCALMREYLSAMRAQERRCFANSQYYCDLLRQSWRNDGGGRLSTTCGVFLSGFPSCFRSRTTAEKDPKENRAHILDSYSHNALAFLGDLVCVPCCDFMWLQLLTSKLSFRNDIERTANSLKLVGNMKLNKYHWNDNVMKIEHIVLSSSLQNSQNSSR